MNCDEVQSRLSEYLENLLDPQTTGSIAGHLSACAHCRAEADDITQTIYLVKALPEIEPPAAFATRVMAYVRETAAQPPFWQRLFLPLRIKLPIHTAALILVSILAAYVYHKEPQQRPLKIAEAERDQQEQDKRDRSPAPESPASVPATKRKEPVRQNQAPTATDSATPSVATGRASEDKKVKAPAYRPESSAPAPSRSAQEKSPAPNEIALGRELPGSATELKGAVGATRAPSENKRKATSSVGAVSAGAAAKTGEPAAASESASASGLPPDRSSAPRAGITPKSAPMVEATTDYELVIRLRSATPEKTLWADRLESQQQEDARASALSPAQKSNLDTARQRATKTDQAQTLWLTIPRTQWAQFKTELAALAQIESESAAGPQGTDDVSKSSAPLRVKVTILPPLSEPSTPTHR